MTTSHISSDGWQHLRHRIAQLVQTDVPSAVESLATEFPDIRANEQLWLDCIYAEFCFREERGQSPATEEFLARFPEHASQLRKLFEIHAALERPSLLGNGPGKQNGSSAPSASEESTNLTVRASQPTLAVAASDCPSWVTSGWIGGYHILQRIASGGMGIVYKAHHPQLDRVAAVKLIKTRGLADDDQARRFELEARAAAKLDHPGIVPVYEIGVHEGRLFLAMAFVEGESLWQRAKTAPLDPKHAARIMQQSAEAIQFAHDRGIVHRDLKPQNILLTLNDQPRITDFGLAKHQGTDSSLTGTGDVLGTPSYMPPEQASGIIDQVGPLSDVYSLGATLYCLVTGRPPFQAASTVDTLFQVLHEEPIPPRTLDPSIPADLETICLKSLQKDPARRYASAQAFADDLARFQNGEPILARPVSRIERAWRWCRKYPMVAGLAATAASLLIAVSIVSSVAFFREWRLVAEKETLAQQESQFRQRAEEIAAENQRLAASEHQLRDESNRQLAFSLFEQSYAKCAPDDAASGLLWLTRALQRAHELGAVDLERAIRRQIAGWSRRVHPVRMTASHPQSVTGVAFSPAGKLVLTVCADRCVRLWNLENGTLHCPPLRHAGEILVAEFSPSGETIATGSADHTAQLWNANGKPKCAPLTHQGEVKAIAFSPDGNWLITGSLDSTAKLWNVETGDSLRHVLQHQSGVTSVDFSSNGKKVVTGSMEGKSQLWDAETGREVGIAFQHQGPLTTSRFSPNGEIVLTASLDKTARLWSAETGASIGPPLSHAQVVGHAIFSPEGKVVATGSADGTARLWETATGLPIGQPLQHNARITSLDFRPDGNVLLTTSLDWKIRLWDVATTRMIGSAINCQSGVRSAAFSLDGLEVFAGDDSGMARAWDVSTTASGKISPVLDCNAHFVSVNSQGNVILTGDGLEARIWDATTLRPVGEPLSYESTLRAAAFSPDGKVVLTATNFFSSALMEGISHTQLWNTETAKPLGPPLVHREEVLAVALSHDGQTYFTGSVEPGVRVWNATTQQRAGEPLPHPGVVKCMDVSPDGKMLITGGEDHSVRRWDLTSRSLIEPLLRHGGQIGAVSFSADGQTIVSGGFDHTARLWNARSGEPVGQPLDHGDVAVQFVQLSPDRETLLTATGQNEAVLWNLEVGKPCCTTYIRRGCDRGLCLMPDGQRILIANDDKTIKVWNVPQPTEGDVDDITLSATVLTGMELNASGALRPLDEDTWKARHRQLRAAGLHNKP